LVRNPSQIPDHVPKLDELTAQKPYSEPLPPQPQLHARHDLHPILQLVDAATREAEETLKKQSKSLTEAVAEYKRRYKINPPPNFDKWYNLAKEKGVQLFDEYDTIYHSLLPFWALPPSVIRGRARESLGFDNALIGISIRNGTIANIVGGEQWQQEATAGMMNDFIKYLPDMDLAFNIHDEPRVVVPHDDLQRLVSKAVDEAIPTAAAVTSPVNKWSNRPKDLNDGKSIPEVRITRFNRFAHQPVWTDSRLSCPPESPARSLNETKIDDMSTYTFSDLGLVQNKTAFSDICNSPSFKDTFGFFDRPNAFDVVHDLFPIFSQSKVSSFQDILYPSPWYWANKVPYRESKDYRWSDKQNVLYWRGSTTGGFSRDGGWRRQHRQHIVRSINALDSTNIMENRGTENNQKWETKQVSKPDYKKLFDVHFSHVGQCDPGDCDAQREFFDIAKAAAQEDAWYYKYLLDIDGNAFSGRFYAFLKSHSLIFKMAIFREWHEEWIKPWLHYVPLSLHCGEYFEVLRYFDQEAEGTVQAVQIAEAGKAWADKVLRNEDFEMWFFRLLLEYGRLVDDNRENLGFKG
jgi:hypothetical protein